ncbi:hypothetical protein HYDPIDRAFT_161787 [Hydnomerulius pinastri MD-312]|uniref:Uncharacterized protein n=1 Tax=Hydnomerulius pinastri MD-312 TaxID=994086 RepID=A0A0C9W9Z0_9AGAM|nr:hypothetical protein HYDPIDRAFT_161787 [Hydnomerulius pinastri MD-312]
MSDLQGHDASLVAGDREKQKALDQFFSHPFSSDEAFQLGLSGILAHESMNGKSDKERSELILKSKLFYFNRTIGQNLTLEDVQARSTADLQTPQSGDEYARTSSESQDGEMRTLTFSELKSLIEQGKTENIPNNKVIPDTLNDGTPSQSIAPVRMKPWEVASQS